MSDRSAATADPPPAEIVIDARGLLCPQPVLALARAARDAPGAVIEVLADDPAAATDIPAWCRMRGAQLLATGADRFVVRAGASPRAGQR